MDDRIWSLIVVVLTAGTTALVVDAVLGSFDVPPGYWTLLAAIIGIISVVSIKRNGNGNGK